MRQRVPLLVAVSMLVACSTTRSVRPVGDGRFSAGLSVGGPIFTNLGPAIPVPLTTLWGRYGLDAKTDLDFGLHVPIVAAVGLDVGASRLLLDQQGPRPAVMAGGRLHLYANPLALTGGKDAQGRGYELGFRAFEELHANASWLLGKKTLVWVSLVLFGQVEALFVRPALGVGVEWRPVPSFGLTLELRQMGFLTDQRFAAVEYLGPANLGALAIQLGFNLHPGAK